MKSRVRVERLVGLPIETGFGAEPTASHACGSLINDIGCVLSEASKFHELTAGNVAHAEPAPAGKLDSGCVSRPSFDTRHRAKLSGATQGLKCGVSDPHYTYTWPPQAALRASADAATHFG